MPLELGEGHVRLVGEIRVDDAEELLGWMQDRDEPRVDLTACTYLHTANLQVLMAARAFVVGWPADPGLADWLRVALAPHVPSGEIR